MNIDIRLAVGFWGHPKTRRLKKALGLRGVRSLQILWCWCAQNRPDGDLRDLDGEDIEFVADWRGKKGAFFDYCLDRWIERTATGYALHEWEDHNPYQAQGASRSDRARKAAQARWKDDSRPEEAPHEDPEADSGNAQAMLTHMPQSQYQILKAI